MSTAPVIRVTARNRTTAVRRAADVLNRGGLVGIPTDTVYGIAAHPLHAAAIERIFVAKQRERGKPIPLLLAGARVLSRITSRTNLRERRLAAAFSPGPLTLVVRSAYGGTEGCRVPDHALARAVIRAAGGVLRVTSANRSGRPPARTAQEVRAALGGTVDLILDGGRAGGGVPSTVARVERGRLRIFRAGALSRETLRRSLAGVRGV